MEITKWGIIGPGSIAQQFANDLQYVQTPQQVQAVLGNHADSTAEFADRFSVPQQFTDIDQFIKEADIDVVYVATPHPLHYEQVKRCLENKLPVLCEKPLTINKEQCRELVNLSKQHDTFLMEGMWIRFLPCMQKLLNVINAGTIGNIISIHASMSFKAPYDPNNRYFDPDKGGGSLLDLGIYTVFLSMLLLGKPRVIKALGKLSAEGIDEACSVLLGYRNGAYAMLESSLITQMEKPAEIAGDKGVIRILHPWYEKSPGLEVTVYDQDKISHPCSWEGHGLQFETEEVLEGIKNKKIESNKLPHAFSLEVMDVMDEIRSQVNVSYDKYE